ncbi:hypothetical protein ACRB68_52560 [Actinomadura sp. RB68]|uniref:Uncharacterized protein n=1 Tax=Actinomadura macrotermitis TaxID=2585200 RepID=A0A7K0C138_9ACTN|nr:hypothetical protein [Actinomadura macrotermitis]
MQKDEGDFSAMDGRTMRGLAGLAVFFMALTLLGI